jgi:hypothetical protein
MTAYKTPRENCTANEEGYGNFGGTPVNHFYEELEEPILWGSRKGFEG